MRSIRSFTSFSLLVALLVSCARNSDRSDTVLLPVLDSSNGTTLEAVQLTTLPSLFRVEGAAARIYMNPRINDHGFSGPIAQPKFSRSGPLLIPSDVESGVALATYAIFEKLYFYDKRVLPDANLNWPRNVGILTNSENSPVRSDETDDAGYLPLTDSYLILPSSFGDKAALALNLGVLAHEHFHAIFDWLFGHSVPHLSRVTFADAKRAFECPTSDLQYQQYLLRSWTEGLADFHGWAVSRNDNYIAASFHPVHRRQAIVANRLISSSPEPIATRAAFVKTFRNNEQALAIGDKRACLGFDPYKSGTQLARVLFGLAKRGEFPAVGADGEKLSKSERAVRYIVERLKDLKPKFAATGLANVEADFLLKYLVQDLRLSRPSCNDLRAAIGVVSFGGFSACAL